MMLACLPEYPRRKEKRLFIQYSMVILIIQLKIIILGECDQLFLFFNFISPLFLDFLNVVTISNKLSNVVCLFVRNIQQLTTFHIKLQLKINITDLIMYDGYLIMPT